MINYIKNKLERIRTNYQILLMALAMAKGINKRNAQNKCDLS